MTLPLAILATITSVADLRSALTDNTRFGEPFEIRATVGFCCDHRQIKCYSICDEKDAALFFCTNDFRVTAGDIVIARGAMATEQYGNPIADIFEFEVLEHSKPPLPKRTSVERLSSEGLQYHPVEVTGELVDVVLDDIDAKNMFLYVRDAGGYASASCARRDYDYFKALIGATVSVRGFPTLSAIGMRKHIGPFLFSNDRSSVTVVAPPPSDPFDCPQLRIGRFAPASAINRLGRCRADGTVLAAWRPNGFLLKDNDGRIIRVDLAQPEPLPTPGTRIAAVGFPETDVFNVNLTRAIFRPASGRALTPDPPVDVSVSELLADKQVSKRKQPAHHGRVIRLRGEIFGRSIRQTEGDTLLLLGDDRIISVYADACPDQILALSRGSVVEVTGVGVLDADSYRSASSFPRIRGFTIVLRSADDIRVLSRPPWWTAGRLLAVIGGLVVLLVAILIWNRLLRRLIRRRSGELARMELAKAMSDLRIDERTRLAVDIHDSLSQTLTGVSFQIDAAEKTVGADDAAARGFLAVARRTLASCREELRRCLWDLRNNAIGEPNFGKAVELVLQPHAKAASVAVRFNVPRADLSDSTAHAILSIVRELTVNAIRHGQAAHVRIAGERREGVIRFSVSDDGTGFDPAHRPGVDEGHFGLQGVRERLNRLGGRIDISSTPGKGTKVIVEIGK